LEELLQLIQIQKTYLSNINQQLLKPEYKNELMFDLKKQVQSIIQSFEFQLAIAEHDLRSTVIDIILRLVA